MDPYDMTYGRVGAPSSLIDLKLINWEEGNYRVTNKPYPQGEIVIGSESIALGYYKMPDTTAENFFEEDGKRWFRTGDIGEMYPDGVLKIIGEIYNFFKIYTKKIDPKVVGSRHTLDLIFFAYYH
jgi:long-chain acyl-CoA synthetase